MSSLYYGDNKYASGDTVRSLNFKLNINLIEDVLQSEKINYYFISNEIIQIKFIPKLLDEKIPANSSLCEFLAVIRLD